ncbi:MAG: hypothetical protein FJ109_02280 [Deltaproteobacteria bacterium]|nr:hypothetical protein [Deltaproteobacteria bacterium]
MSYRADPHIHTCLSPCGDLDMHPREIVRQALQVGLDLIAVCDHNHAGNAASVTRAAAALEAAAGSRLVVLPGIEVCTVEEVHLVALLPTLQAAAQLQAACLDTLTALNDPDAFGLQVLADEDGGVDGFEKRLLLAATSFSLEEAVRRIRCLDGLVILAHADREAFGILGQLGFVPPSLDFDAAEATSAAAVENVAAALPRGRPVIATSDAHLLHEIGRRFTVVEGGPPSFDTLARALRIGAVTPEYLHG